MKVCMLVHDFDRIGGYEKQAFALSKALKGKGLDVFILTNKMRAELISLENREGVTIHRIWPFLGYTLFFRFTIFNALLWFLLKNHKNFDIIHAHALTHLSVMAILLGKIFGKKSLIKIATAGDLTKIMNSQQLRYQLLFKFFRYADGFISLSNQITSELLKSGIDKEKIHFAFNGVDIVKFYPVDPEQKNLKRKSLFLPQRQTIVFVGRLVPRKGVDILLKAFKCVKEKHQGTHLLILGDGEQMQALKGLCRSANLDNSVSFLGEKDNIADYLRAADIFVIPSRREGNPNVLLEALACGLPVVATSIGGIVEVIKDGENGLLIVSEDEKMLAEKILFLLGNENYCEKLRRRAREEVRSRFSLDSLASKYLELYERLLSKQ